MANENLDIGPFLRDVGVHGSEDDPTKRNLVYKETAQILRTSYFDGDQQDERDRVEDMLRMFLMKPADLQRALADALFPVDVKKYPCLITSRFGWRGASYPSSPYHTGIDIAPRGIGSNPSQAFLPQILAVLPGVVDHAGDGGSYGNLVRIKHENYRGATGTFGTVYTNYAHLKEIYVSKGDSVNRGDKIGLMGSTGGRYPIHLHFEVSFTSSDARVGGRNPLTFFPAFNTLGIGIETWPQGNKEVDTIKELEAWVKEHHASYSIPAIALY